MNKKTIMAKLQEVDFSDESRPLEFIVEPV